MKKMLTRIIILLSLILAVALFLCSCSNTERFDVSYDASLGGAVHGELNQCVRQGNHGAAVMASPSRGYRFVKWSDGVTTATRQDKNIQSSFNVTAEFERIVLTVKYTAGAGGNIIGEAEQNVYYGDDAKTITAAAANGYLFVGWSNGLTAAERTDTSVTTNITVLAEFVRIGLTVKYTAGTGGHIAGEAYQSVLYGEITSEVTAVPNEGYRFVKWSDGVTVATREDNIQASINVTAEFERIVLTVKYTARTGGNIIGEAQQNVYYGDNASSVTVNVNVNEGYFFIGWSDGIKDLTRHDINVKTPINVTALIFSKELLKVQYTAGIGGSIIGESEQSIYYGDNAKVVTAVAADGYKFVKWSDEITTATRQDINLQTAINITAQFERITYTVIYNTSIGGTITGTTSQTIAHGNNATMVTAVASTGYKFSKWSDNVTTASRADVNVTSIINATAEFERIVLTVKYIAETGGSIVGEDAQNVYYGDDAKTITAVTANGYRFVKWSDGLTTAIRLDTYITIAINVVAEFEVLDITKTYSYYYDGATANNTEETIAVNSFQLHQAVFAVPQKTGYTFVGWFLELKYLTNNGLGSVEYSHLTQITDGFGNLLAPDDYEIFFSASDTLYAVWAAEEEIVYKILLVFVTEIHAVVNDIAVDYIMPDLERQISEMIASQTSGILNEWFDGLIRFEVDSFFTTESINDGALFRHASDMFGNISYRLCAREIIEVREMVGEYQSVVTFFSVDIDSELFVTNASANAKYAAINLQSCFHGSRINNIPLENFLDAEYKFWTDITDDLLHEFAHTVEDNFYGPNNEGWFPNDPREFHTVINEYKRKGLRGLPVIRLYLLNLAIVQGQRVGIAYELWKIANR